MCETKLSDEAIEAADQILAELDEQLDDVPAEPPVHINTDSPMPYDG